MTKKSVKRLIREVIQEETAQAVYTDIGPHSVQNAKHDNFQSVMLTNTTGQEFTIETKFVTDQIVFVTIREKGKRSA